MPTTSPPTHADSWPRRDEHGLTDAQHDKRDHPRYTKEERWLLGEPREAGDWVIGTDKDKQRMHRFYREAYT